MGRQVGQRSQARLALYRSGHKLQLLLSHEPAHGGVLAFLRIQLLLDQPLNDPRTRSRMPDLTPALFANRVVPSIPVVLSCSVARSRRRLNTGHGSLASQRLRHLAIPSHSRQTSTSEKGSSVLCRAPKLNHRKLAKADCPRISTKPINIKKLRFSY